MTIQAAKPFSIEALAHTRLADCYQCGKCTAGCPVATHMDIAPNRIIRMVQLGQAPAAMRSRAIWQCVSCQTCSTRCPKAVDCASVMDALRELAMVHGLVEPSQQPIASFQKAFLNNIQRNGRLNELELIAQFKSAVFFRSGRLAFLLKDAGLAQQLARRRKLHLIPGKVSDRKLVSRIFSKCANS